MDNTDRAKTVQKPCTHGLQNKKAMKSFDFTAFSGAMEGTRTPGLLIRRNQTAHFVHFIIRREIVILIELQLFFRHYSIVSFALFALPCTCYPSLRCAENVQKCAEPKSARQDDLKINGFPAGFFGALEAQKFPISSRQQSYMTHRFFGRV